VPIRLRLALAFAAATLVLFGITGFLFLRSFRDGLESSLNPGLRTQANTLSRLLQDPNAVVDLRDESPTGALRTQETVAQVLDADGRVLQSTEEAGRRSVISRPTARDARRERVYSNVEVGSEREREPFRVLAEPVPRDDAGRIVVVGESLEETDEAVGRVRDALLAGGAVAVGLAGIGAWLLAGAALRPVERMRRQAAEISEHDPTSRLPVPATRDELAALGATMNDLLARLQEALRRQRAFVADAGHELRTPLAVLRTELELAARRHRTREELLDTITNATEETDRLARLAEELLFLARSEDQAIDRRDDVRLLPLLERSAEAIRARAADRGVTVTSDGANAGTAAVDPDLLRRALDNLLENALRYAPPQSTVTLRVQRDDGGDGDDEWIEIEVIDEGPGFPPEFLPHAFERFRRADDARSRADGGAGLGLAIVLAVARAHGGTATAGNGPTGGAVVTLRIPRAQRGNRG
jgi:two-component system, OmpR family, sensor kinase